jgi:hypothetical protein
MRQLAVLVGLVLTVPAQAGGLGLMFSGGGHGERVWFYSSHSYEGSDPVAFEAPKDYQQYEQNQFLPSLGGGAELILGDRDDKITGSFRVYYLNDAAQKDPATLTSDVKKEHVVAAYRDTSRHIGMGMVGLNWGIVGDPGGFMFGVSGHVGSGFLTTDHTEFLAVDIGPMVTYKLNRAVQIHADVLYTGRHHKLFDHGFQTYAGIRYLFD